MELKSLVNYKSAFQTIKVGALIIVVLCLLLVGFMGFLLLKKSDEATAKIWILDSSTGNAYEAVQGNAYDVQNRIFEYQAHVKDFYKLWYAWDESSYERNIANGLYLVGETGKDLLNKYEETNMWRTIQENNLKTIVTIEKVDIDMNTIPKKGAIYGTQTARRPGGEVTRKIYASFEIYDIDRSELNPHGVILENWVVFDGSKVE